MPENFVCPHHRTLRTQPARRAGRLQPTPHPRTLLKAHLALHSHTSQLLHTFLTSGSPYPMLVVRLSLYLTRSLVRRFASVRCVAFVPVWRRKPSHGPNLDTHSTRDAGRAAPADPALPRTLLKAHLALHRHLLYTTHSLLPRLTQPVKPTSLFTYSFHSSSSFRLTTIHSAHLLRPRLFSLTCTSLDAKVFRNLAPLSVHGLRPILSRSYLVI